MGGFVYNHTQIQRQSSLFRVCDEWSWGSISTTDLFPHIPTYSSPPSLVYQFSKSLHKWRTHLQHGSASPRPNSEVGIDKSKIHTYYNLLFFLIDSVVEIVVSYVFSWSRLSFLSFFLNLTFFLGQERVFLLFTLKFFCFEFPPQKLSQLQWL